jgi:hypothetical protein
MSRLLLVCVLVGLPARAAAQDDPRAQADALVRKGNELGGAGKLAEAIAAFKEAEQLVPRAVPLCNIGLAYGKLGKPALAHLYLRRCRERWTATEDKAAPAWIDAELAKLDKQLVGGHGRIDLKLRPADARAVTSAFAADDPLPAGRIWLPLGDHTITVSADEHDSKTVPVHVSQGTQGLAITHARTTDAVAPPPRDPPPPVDGRKPPAVEDRPPEPIDRPMPPPRRSRLPFYTGIGGVLLLGGGVTFHVLALGAKDEAEKYAADDPRFASHASDFRRDRALAIGLYAAAGVALAATTYLILRTERGPAVGAAPTRGGAAAVLTWTLP